MPHLLVLKEVCIYIEKIKGEVKKKNLTWLLKMYLGLKELQ